jgi:hypothetical protein
VLVDVRQAVGSMARQLRVACATLVDSYGDECVAITVSGHVPPEGAKLLQALTEELTERHGLSASFRLDDGKLSVRFRRQR